MRQTSPSLRILQIVSDTDRRGAQVFACDLGAYLASLGHHVRTVALTHGTKHPMLDLPTLGAAPRGLRTLRALRAAMQEVDVAVAHGSSTLLASALASVGLRQPWVYRQISDSRFWAPSIARRARVAMSMRRASRIVALSPRAARTLHDYLHVPLQRIAVVPNGVPATGTNPSRSSLRLTERHRFGVPAEHVVALYVGALVPEKGVDLAIEAVGATPATHLIVVGEGPQRAQLERLAEHVAPGRVTFVGGLEDVRPAYAAADLLMLTSRGGDSMPAVLIEAGLSGLATITCPVGEITDVVHDGVTGLVVPIGDQAAVTAALNRLVTNSDEARQMGQAAHDLCSERFVIDVVAEQWLGVLRSVVNHQPGEIHLPQ